MSRGPNGTSGVVKDIRILSQNVYKNYEHVDYLLEHYKDIYDVLFIQEPPWRTIRRTISTVDPEGDPVVGAPKHPDWLTVVRVPPGPDSPPPRVLGYVHNRLARLHPAMRRDVVDHQDILLVTLFTL